MSPRTIRANIAVALGDLVVMHPNVLEPWTAQIYAQLRDSSRAQEHADGAHAPHPLAHQGQRAGRVAEIALRLLDGGGIAARQALLLRVYKKANAPITTCCPTSSRRSRATRQ